MLTTSGPMRRRMKRGLVVFTVALVCAGIGSASLGFLRPAWDVLRAMLWVQTPMEQFGEKADASFHGITHHRFYYEYTFNDKRYSGNRYSFVYPRNGVDVRSVPICYVNPRYPYEAVVKRDLPMWAYRYSGLMVLLLAWLLVWWTRRTEENLAPELPPELVSELPRKKSEWDSWAARLVRWPTALVLFLFGLMCSQMPFFDIDIDRTTDSIHDPNYRLESLLNWIALMLLFWIAAYGLAFGLRKEPEPAPVPPLPPGAEEGNVKL